MINSMNIRLYIFIILQYKRFCLYLLNKNYRKKLNCFRMLVEDWRLNIYKWKSCRFINFKFSVSSKVKKELEINRIKKCQRVIYKRFQEICLNKIKEDEIVSESDFNKIEEDERISEDDVNKIEECERIIYKEFQDERIIHVQFFVVVLVIRNVFFILRLNLLISKSCSCFVFITSMNKDLKDTCWKSLTVNNKLCSVFLCQFSALISTTLR